MPKVPTYDNFEVAQNNSPTSPFNTLMSVEAGALPGKQLAMVGQGLTSAGNDMAKVVYDIQKDANAVRVDDALNQAKSTALSLMYDKSTGFTSQKGLSALQRDSGKPLADEYLEKYQQSLSEIDSKLGNNAQREVFAAKAKDLMAQFHGAALKHEATEYQTYAQSVQEGTIKNSMNEIGLSYNNSATVDSAVQRITEAGTNLGRLQGKSPEWIEANNRKLTSNAHLLAIGAAIEKEDIKGADAYLAKYSKQMDADDILKVKAQIGKQIDVGLAYQSVDNAFSKLAPSIITSDANRAFNIAIGSESAGKQFDKDGKPLTSNKGAVGVTQVMPSTGPEAARLAGVPWNEELFNRKMTGDPVKDNEAKAYNEVLGRAYFQKQLQDFHGNLAQTYAAYNAGPQAVKDYLNGTNISGKNPNKIKTEDGIPPFPETIAYVNKNMQAFNEGRGANKKPTIKDVIDTVDAEMGNASPQVKKIAQDYAISRFKNLEFSQTQREDESTAAAINGLLQNGGNFMALPADVRGNVPSEDMNRVIDYAKRVATGTQETNLEVYNKLTNPVTLNNMSDAKFATMRTELSESDFKKFSDQRDAVRTG
jgi:soluble lytic murein transglycosylase